MVETTQYSFELKEVAAALVKERGIHEGLWQLNVEIVFGPGQFGPTQTDLKPGVFMSVGRLQITRVNPDAPEAAIAVDAAVVNPRTHEGRASEKAEGGS